VKMKGKYSLKRKTVKKGIDTQNLFTELTQLPKIEIVSRRLGVGTRTKYILLCV